MRRSGRTTRQVDEAVQTLLTTGVVSWNDHATPNNSAQWRGWKILLRRLWSEHNLNENNLIVDRKNWTLKLK